MAMKFGKPRRIRKYRPRRYRLSRVALIFLIVAAALYIPSSILFRLAPAVRTLAGAEIEHLGVGIIEQAVSTRLGQSGVDYPSLTQTVTDQNGKVLSVSANVTAMNKIKSALTVDILNSLSAQEYMTLRLPLGILLDSELLSGIGPELQVPIVPYGTVQVDFRSEFLSAGINQTRHEIYLDVTAHMGALLPGGDAIAEVTTSVPVAQTLIVGGVPQLYAQ
ncbi:MAG: sporulation protein YunB [Ruminococcaceae bacterium]|nr:sporulation protein YunB [Oscillospiraceae bacterium]